MSAPDFLFHHTLSSNRDNILHDGLLQPLSEAAQTAASMGMEGGSGIFFCEKRPKDDPRVDIWRVDVRGLELFPDDTTEPTDSNDTWWVFHSGDIGPERMEFLQPQQDEQPAFKA